VTVFTVPSQFQLNNIHQRASTVSTLVFSAVDELFDSADSALFRAVLTIPKHVLHPLFPPRKKTGYNLRKHSHGLMLPEAKSSFLQNNFLVRMLYTDVY